MAVVGGGPAGAATALHLARRGFAVCLLDRARFPRDKACGEFLSPGATPILADLGVRERMEAAGARRVSRVRIAAHGEPPLDLTFPDGGDAPPWGYSLSRRRLDAILVAAAASAGAEIRTGIQVDGLVRSGGVVAGVRARPEGGEEEELRARIVVGAGGRNCPVARELGLQRRARSRRYDLLAHWTAGGEIPSVCELHVGVDGYVAAAPVEGGRVNVNCVLPQARLRETRDPEAAYRRALADHPALESWTREAPVEAVAASDVTPLRTTRATADGALLVGDSALFIDPFTGQGIYLALRSAALAARVAASALEAGRRDSTALAAYDRMRILELAAKRRVSQALQAILFRPRLTRQVIRALRADPVLAGSLAAVTGDLAPARRVWSIAYGGRLARVALGA